MSQPQDPFKEIRPYKDTEVVDVLNGLLRNDELVSAVCSYQFPNASGPLGWLLKPVVRIALARKLGDVETIQDFQMLMASYMEKMISRTTRNLTVSGIDELDPEEGYLFVSNHRDIAMDPAFVNWVRHQFGMDTVRIAIGDNLLTKPYVSDLMRLNKSFIVNRSATAPREMMAAFTQLSAYIDDCIQHNHSVWIAQREGRAKDGNDRTDPTILKMFYMSHRKAKRDFPTAMKRLKIVPVSISYQYDPCDALKAKELHAKQVDGHYEKGEHEDIASIVEGIRGYKGDVHVAFGDVIENDFDTPEDLAAEIDRQIHATYKLHSSNLLAAGEAEEVDESEASAFEARMADLSQEQQAIFKRMYAFPLENRRAVEAIQTQKDKACLA
ncbi:MAG: 1-acyl-sn-glycerol-3-phosphate acyltransferase [Pontibacterium sp.]